MMLIVVPPKRIDLLLRVVDRREPMRFYTFRAVWQRSKCVGPLKGRLALVLIFKLYRQMYANTGIAIDNARREQGHRLARWLARSCRRLFVSRPQLA